MSLKAMIWVMEDAPVSSHAELAVLYALADRANDDGTAAWPSQAWISERARCSIRTVRRHLASLEASGVISRGDQRLVGHLPGNRRPFVWDLDMSLTREDQGGHHCPPKMEDQGGKNDRPGDNGPSQGGQQCPPTGEARADNHDTQGGQSRHSGRTAVSDKPSLNHPEPSKGGTVVGNVTGGAASNVKPSAEIPESWIADPRRARCAAHSGIDAPPPCRACATARHAAEGLRDAKRRQDIEAQERRRAERDACSLCDANGIASTAAGLIRCPHDETALAEAVSGSLSPSGAEPDHDPAGEPVGPSPALLAWRRRRETRTVPADNQTEPDHDQIRVTA